MDHFAKTSTHLPLPEERFSNKRKESRDSVFNLNLASPSWSTATWCVVVVFQSNVASPEILKAAERTGLHFTGLTRLDAAIFLSAGSFQSLNRLVNCSS